MKTKLHYLIMALLFGFAMNAQNAIISVVGSGVSGWDNDHDLVTTDGIHYTKTGLEIVGDGTNGTSEIKFRKNHMWGSNASGNGADWGYLPANGPGWPSGVGVAAGATNIPGVPGFWDVTFNLTTLEYTFIPGVNPNPTIKVTGTAVGPDDRTLSTTDGVAYSKESVTFSTGTAKFIQGAPSTNQWASSAFPDGIGTQTGALIPVTAGTYYVYFYRNSGEYSFFPTTVSIIGSFNGWGGDIDMTTTDNITFTLNNHVFISDVTLKFRDNHNWNFAYGSTVDPPAFPAGLGGGINKDIAVPAGVYNITFNRSTLEYNFVAVAYPVIKITGTALATDVTMSTTDGTSYFKDGVDFAAGNAKFVEDGTANQWSSAVWPTGTGTQAGALIPVVANSYNVTFNKTTGAYNFGYLTMSLVGGFNNWNGDIDMDALMTTTDGITYTRDQVFTADTEMKFRVNHGWGTAFGSSVPDVAGAVGTFPTGTGATIAGNTIKNIPVLAGSYHITFNRNAMSYDFTNLGVNAFSTSNFSVYPNPTSNVWNFVSANGTAIDAIQIMDVLGKVVVNTKGTSVNASQLTNGVYFAKITSNNAVQTVKVIKN